MAEPARRPGRAWVRASHPEPAAAVTAVAVLLAAGIGHTAGRIVAIGATVLASQLAIGWTNDSLDADRDARAGRSDKPVAAGVVSPAAVGTAGLLASLAVPPLGALCGWPAALAATAGLASAQLYNWPLKSTAVSVLPYAVSFALLPTFVVLALPGAPAPPAWLPLAGGLLGAGAHFANVLPDLADDARTGVHGLPHRLGERGSRLAAAGLLLAATAALAFGPPGPPSWPGVAALVLAVVVLLIGWYAGRAASARGDRSVAAFRAVMAVALIDVVLLVISGSVV
jgi:4-hydroxybenzoate polyprenyltransferase